MESMFDQMSSSATKIQLFQDIIDGSQIFHQNDNAMAHQVLESTTSETPECLMENNFTNAIVTLLSAFSAFIKKMRSIYQSVADNFRYLQSKWMSHSSQFNELLKKINIYPVLLKKRECRLVHYVFDLQTGDQLVKKCRDVLEDEINRIGSSIGMLENLDSSNLTSDDIYSGIRLSSSELTDVHQFILSKVPALSKYTKNGESSIRSAIKRSYYCGNDNIPTKESYFSASDVREMIRYCSSVNELITMTNNRLSKLEDHVTTITKKISRLKKSNSHDMKKMEVLTSLSLYAGKLLVAVNDLDVSIEVYGNIFKGNMQNLVRLNQLIVDDVSEKNVTVPAEYNVQYN